MQELTIKEAASLVNRSRSLVAFSGAGVSEESGIPTFRDPGGIWDRFDPYEVGGGDIFTTLFSGAGDPRAAMDFVTEMLDVLERAHPNPGHLALGELEGMGILRSVITQNIDGLHGDAGNTRVIEVHGSIFRLACLACGRKIPVSREDLFRTGRELVELMRDMDIQKVIRLISRCSCGGACRLDVVGFGEAVQGMTEAVAEAQHCDLFLILGTSGAVYPAAYLPEYAKKAGAKLIEINATGCYFPDLVDIGITGKSGDVLPRIVAQVRSLRG